MIASKIDREQLNIANNLKENSRSCCVRRTSGMKQKKQKEKTETVKMTEWQHYDLIIGLYRFSSFLLFFWQWQYSL